jgi:putative membrane protein
MYITYDLHGELKLCADKRPTADNSQQHLANERTFLSWLRTSIALIGLGFIVARFGLFLREFGLVVKNANEGGNNSVASAVSPFGHYQSSLIGISIIILGIAFVVLALRSYVTARCSIDKGFYIPSNFNVFAASISLVFLGILIIVYLFVVLPASNS